MPDARLWPESKSPLEKLATLQSEEELDDRTVDYLAGKWLREAADDAQRHDFVVWIERMSREQNLDASTGWEPPAEATFGVLVQLAQSGRGVLLTVLTAEPGGWVATSLVYYLADVLHEDALVYACAVVTSPGVISRHLPLQAEIRRLLWEAYRISETHDAPSSDPAGDGGVGQP